ncbi:hypothetical protein Vadar_003390 [Vaccinium darrowii]|uniref:Uncharacterized protein n=1 Tax=Vaccinium darrowii TaxID=229202 RepID=A0ACB7WXL1_9ERIC|nr:hypothetical protein Vadar_003390 [Vaccinium darrowii]
MELKKSLKLELLGFMLLNVFVLSMARKALPSINFVLKETEYTRSCSSKKILTVNGQFPGPPLYVHKGDRLIVNVYNQGTYNVTIHWHGVKQPRNPWSDGPNYVTQCPIKPGANFSYEIIFSAEEGTLWWHAHSDWTRATVHGPIIVYPSFGTTYPFPKPHAEFPIVLGEWYKGDVMEIIQSALISGGEPNMSDAYTINGQPGDLYNCSKPGTFNIMVDYGKTYLLRLIGSIMNEEMFFAVAQHNLTVVGKDGAYIKPIKTDYIVITPGQTVDILLTANKSPNHYYMAASAYAGASVYDNTTTTAIVKYSGNYTAPSTPAFPSHLPNYTDIDAVTNFTNRIRALASKDHPVDVPQKVDTRLYITISVGSVPCVNNSCEGPQGGKLAASLNNISFVEPVVDLLQAYYRKTGGIFTTDFPDFPPYFFNFTADGLPFNLSVPLKGTKVNVLEFNSSVEIVFQVTNVSDAAENHPMHLHGYSFYNVGYLDLVSEILIIRPTLKGVWFMHCYLDRHSSWGMDMAFIVKNGPTSSKGIGGVGSGCSDLGRLGAAMNTYERIKTPSITEALGVCFELETAPD